MKEYYEVKVMQSMGLIDSSVDPVKEAEKRKEDKRIQQPNENFREIENHMVIGEYYDNKGE